MTAIDLHQELLEHLGRHDEVSASQLMKRETASSTDALTGAMTVLDDGELTVERIDEQLVTLSSTNERLLAVAFPIVEYGSERLLFGVGRALTLLSEVSLGRAELANPGVLAELVIGRLGWSLSAYALFANRLDGLSAVMSAPINRAYEERSQPRFATDSRLRHSRRFQDRARETIDSYANWLIALELVQHLPLFEPGQRGGFFDEADLVLALALHGDRGRAFTNRLQPQAALRLGARLADERNRAHLSAALALPADSVVSTVDQWYQELRSNMQREMSFDLLPERLTQGA